MLYFFIIDAIFYQEKMSTLDTVQTTNIISLFPQ